MARRQATRERDGRDIAGWRVVKRLGTVLSAYYITNAVVTVLLLGASALVSG